MFRKNKQTKSTKHEKMKFAAICLTVVAAIVWIVFGIIYFRVPVTTRMDDAKALEYMLSLDKEKIQPYLDSCSGKEAERLIKLMIYNQVLEGADADSFTVSGNGNNIVSENQF